MFITTYNNITLYYNIYVNIHLKVQKYKMDNIALDSLCL